QTGKLLFFRVRPVRQIPVRAEPVNLSIRIECLSTQHPMRLTKGDHATDEAENFPMLFQTPPVMPARFVVLAVRIIVAALRAAKFVPSQEHRYATRNQEAHKEVLDLTCPDGLDLAIRCLTFHAVTLAEVIVGPVM